jgi:hypothetical protein
MLSGFVASTPLSDLSDNVPIQLVTLKIWVIGAVGVLQCYLMFRVVRLELVIVLVMALASCH